MTLSAIPLTTISGTTTTFGEFVGKVILVVNVASRCGYTPQYEQLETLQKTYGSRGFSVLGFPSSQFKQELDTDAEIADYCSTTWGVTFPMFEKTDVNGEHESPLFTHLKLSTDVAGEAGDVAWNFEKFLITPTGQVHRFRTDVEPDAPEIIGLIESSLPAAH